MDSANSGVQGMSNNAVPTKPVIVIAEDSRVQGLVLQQRLAAAGYEPHVGLNGQLALELIRQHSAKITCPSNSQAFRNS